MDSREIGRRAIEFGHPPGIPFWQDGRNRPRPGVPDDIGNIWEMGRQQAGWFFDTPGADDWCCGWSITETKKTDRWVTP